MNSSDILLLPGPEVLDISLYPTIRIDNPYGIVQCKDLQKFGAPICCTEKYCCHYQQNEWGYPLSGVLIATLDDSTKRFCRVCCNIRDWLRKLNTEGAIVVKGVTYFGGSSIQALSLIHGE